MSYKQTNQFTLSCSVSDSFCLFQPLGCQDTSRAAHKDQLEKNLRGSSNYLCAYPPNKTQAASYTVVRIPSTISELRLRIEEICRESTESTFAKKKTNTAV